MKSKRAMLETPVIAGLMFERTEGVGNVTTTEAYQILNDAIKTANAQLDWQKEVRQ